LEEALVHFHSTRACTGCGMLWNCDTNASKNIYHIANEALKQQDRPAYFCRQ
jgi:hypothetical protein